MIDESEYVLRRIHRNFVSAGANQPILYTAFRPNENDQDGLSVFRAAVVAPAELAAAAAQPAENYIVAQLRVADLVQLGLSVVLDDAQIPGHCLVPEITVDSYRMDKRLWRPVLKKLSLLAATDVVFGSIT